VGEVEIVERAVGVAVEAEPAMKGGLDGTVADECVVQRERLGDPLGDDLGQPFAQRSLDEYRCSGEVGVAVHEPLTGPSRRWLGDVAGEDLFTGVLAGEVAEDVRGPLTEAGGVVEQHGEGCLVGGGQLWEPRLDRVVQRQPSLLDKLQGDRGDEGLGDAGGGKGAVARHRCIGLAVVDSGGEMDVVVAGDPD
jgi:hypothetical protein